MTGRTCRTCRYAVGPNAAGCLCTRGNVSTFHAGLEPCKHHKLAEAWKGIAKRGAVQ